MGVKFVTPKEGDAVAVVARSVEAPDSDDDEAGAPTTPVAEGDGDAPADAGQESPEVGSDATIDEMEADSPPESEA